MSHKILIVDDEPSIRVSLTGILEDENYQVLEAESGEKALEILAQEPFSAVLLDIWMDGIDGIETLRRIRSKPILDGINGGIPVIMMSGHGTIDTAVSATKEGAYDFLEKPLSLDRVLLLLDRAIREWALVRENRDLKARIKTVSPLLGESRHARGLRNQIQRLAPTDGWVLITGENGVGKEVAARQIHAQSLRRQGPFIPLNSAAIPEERIEIELFGQEEGRFEKSPDIRPGRFEQANGGTLFLDAIGDMTLRMQSKILRVLQEQRFHRVDGRHPIEVNVRVITASNKNLEMEIAEGRFRQDLYYRLNVIPLFIPPLRDRLEDIPLLVTHFIQQQRESLPRERSFSDAALKCLMGYHWPGNVRELKNLVERLMIMAPASVIEPEDLPEFIHKRSVSPASTPWESLLEIGSLREARQGFERIYLKTHLERNENNISRTAEAIGMERSALHRKFKNIGLG
ncbi:MAG: sigma-54-dependent Fis family transcriptional regulator [Magnetococcales bacterium]|nr:sigma-54-dependent Fis family transcriptional regulator [Magnetococcales bacterium]MBF0150859.1 sigma-54-dependent Fis family transcriptional regulator [Magnetococcales bacterium]MBF0173854.1 sigma-54-dependent Fis family transcriptional regulator [Magnetococcales bacterium]MBF0347008.1 sigma-54-dependent Fis family transcriptional regulator [Magnetococcales bacterium]MBF0631328.1 sigma-54-dependent Fis family transcriptional regulator [Magnetococcales bacterium]